ncbi:MAG: methyl-accepting chemotaxis protein [Spirochaetes bacterium]|nr:methyl-accepting chemotaxis protein [Spirochaetota bacterium]
MKISTKLILAFTVLVLMIAGIASYSFFRSRNALEETLGTNSIFIAEGYLLRMNEALEKNVEILQIQTPRRVLQEAIAASNLRYRKLEDVPSHMDRLDKQWTSATPGSTIPLMHDILDSELSLELKKTLINLYEKKQGSRQFEYVLVTNEYGAPVAMTTRNPFYRHDNEEWFKTVKKNRLFVGDVEFDESFQKTVIPVAVPVIDDNGRFIGAIKASVSADGVIRKTLLSLKRYKTTELLLMTTSGKAVYSTNAFRFHEDLSGKPYFKNIKGLSGYFTVEEGQKQRLFSYVYSEKFGAFISPHWVLLVQHDLDEVLAKSFILRKHILIATVIVLILGITIAVYISRTISKPLHRAREIALKMSKGDLSERISIRTHDEIGSLMQSLDSMIDTTKRMAELADRISHGDLTGGVQPRSEKDVLGNALAHMVSDLKGQVSDIIEGANVIATATGEITAAASQLVAGSSETATSISQTTATVEEVKQASTVANEKAKEVSEVAQKSMLHSQRGQEAVKKVIEGMGSIKDRMKQLAGDIMNLSDQSHAIGQIIATVNDIAEQTNLLSVNAAIEAMKAGEYGKGFSVVAGEIKSLSEQSKRATTQVKTILNDIQKAIGQAVMATEEGSKVIEAGVRQSEEAGETIEVLAQNIVGASEASTQIAASSQQQLVGMDQVALAMVSIREASAQNVNSTRQVENSAKNLHELGQRLRTLTANYKL